jgi:hypothetical protein
MSLASNSRRDDTWFDASPTGDTLIPDQTFATPRRTPSGVRTLSKVDTLLSTPWFGETASDADEWRKVIAERRARASAVPTVITPAPAQLRPLQGPPTRPAHPARPALMPQRRVPLWMLAVLSSGLLFTSALLMGALAVLASLLLLFLV